MPQWKSVARALVLAVIPACLCGALCGPAFCQPAGAAPARLVDGFSDLSAWSARPADGVTLAIRPDSGDSGPSMRLDFKFVKGGGYAVVHRALSLDLPANYAFSFRVRGACLPQDLEFKLIDSTGDNVWWCNRRNFDFPPAWQTLITRRRKIEFAWGPAGGGDIRHVAALEFAVTAGSGGEGSVWIEDLRLQPLPPPQALPPAPVARASSEAPAHPASMAVDGDTASAWISGPGDIAPCLTLDLGAGREIGGLVLQWAPGGKPRAYRVEASDDSLAWRNLWTGQGGPRLRDPVFAPETDTRFVRVRATDGAPAGGAALRGVQVKPVEWSASREAFFRDLAAHSQPGNYPRGISGQNQFWTIVGPDGGPAPLLFSEDGAIETRKGGPSVEPFLWLDGRLLTWHDVHASQWLEDGDLPMPAVRWRAGTLDLTVTAFAAEQLGDSLYWRRKEGSPPPRQGPVLVRYQLTNRGRRPRAVKLFLALRPFQVDPPAQFLNHPGGAARVAFLYQDASGLSMDTVGLIRVTPASDSFGATNFEASEIIDVLRAGGPRERERGEDADVSDAQDPFEAASAAWAFEARVPAGASVPVAGLVIPAAGANVAPGILGRFSAADARGFDRFFRREQAIHRAAWRARLGRVQLQVGGAGGQDLVQTLKAQVAYMRVSRNGPGLEPGTRSYDRTWIRDGSLMSSALLRMGQPEVVKDFLSWFAGYTYDNGKVPCCVDRRGSDPVPENDSHGEFIFLAAEYFRYTGDRATLESVWPRVRAAAGYLDSLRAQRRTAAYREPGREKLFGLLPESISHEGYSARPMHSYWDDFFALRGFKDAAYLADALGHGTEAAGLAADRDEFQRELLASIAAAMKSAGIDYIPGCAELGDFDATSTTIALDPAGAGAVLPAAALDRTFSRYDKFFTGRLRGAPWEAFTPYEMRTLGSYVRLGWRDRLPPMLRFFLASRKPVGWRQWPEVVWHDDRAPKFIGDLPHTWVGSDFVRSVLDMFAYVRESDSALVVGAGVTAEWVKAPGVRVRGLRTPMGDLDLSMLESKAGMRVTLGARLRVPPGGIVVEAPVRGRELPPLVNGRPQAPAANGDVVVRKLPATVLFRTR